MNTWASAFRRRARVKQGSLSLARPDAFAVCDRLWRQSPCADVLFAAIEAVRRELPDRLWPLLRDGPGRVDNWCHSDALAGLRSRLLEAREHEVYPQIEAWNAGSALWLRRLSIASLVHYTGKNAVFLPAERLLPLLQTCVADHRPSMQLALGWALREAQRAHPDAVRAFIERHAGAMGATALRRATDKLAPGERARLLALRNTRHG